MPHQIHNAKFLAFHQGTQAAARYLKRLGFSLDQSLAILKRGY